MVLTVYLMFVLTTALAADGPEVHASIERATVYEGETIRYRVLVEDVSQDVTPKIDQVDGVEIQFVGTQQVSSQEINIINGKAQTTVHRRLIHEYALTAIQAGNITIPAPVVEINGKPYAGNAVTLSVIGAVEQDVAILELTTSRREVYPMQPFDVTLTVLVKPVPEPHSDKDPTAVQDPPVALTIPWADDDEQDQALIAKVPRERWLGELLSDGGGFSINGEPSARSGLDPFDRFFFESRFRRGVRAFRPPPRRVLRPDADGRRQEYWAYTFTRTFIPHQVGEYALGPVSLKGVFGTRTDSRGRLEGEPVYAFARPVMIRVKDVPTHGRPDAYVGAVGLFEVTAELTPREAKVGDPLTLTLSLQGQGTLETASAPRLDALPSMADAFKVYEATEETIGDTRRFTYSLRPRHAQITELPPLPISYFDVEQEQFVTLQTPSIPIEITDADKLAAEDIALATPPAKTTNPIETRLEGIFANITDPRQLRDEAVHPDRWFAGLGGLAGLFFITALVAQQVRRRQSDSSRNRRRGAETLARSRLRAARACATAGSKRNTAEQLSSALIGVVGDMTNAPAGSLTSDDAAQRLEQLGIATDCVTRLRAVLQDCDGARYGAGERSLDQLVSAAESLLEELLPALKGKRPAP